MTTPINKKSGFEFKRNRERKSKLQQEVLNKTKKLDSFFKPTNVNVSSSTENEQSNGTLQQNSINLDDSHVHSITTLEVDADSATQTVFDCRSIGDDPSKWPIKDPAFVDFMIRNPMKQDAKSLFDSGSCPDTVFDNRDKLRINFFYVTLDAILVDLRLKTNAYEENMKPFVFLTDMENLTGDEIRIQAQNLKQKYDVDLDDGIGDECVQFKYFLADINEEIKKDIQNMPDSEDDDEGEDEDDEEHDTKKKKTLKYSKSSMMLQYIKKNKIEATFPNIEVALRILESIAVCNATGELSFSSLKRIKGPLRSTLTEANLNDLAILFINNDILNQIDTDEIISKFAAAKARKVNLKTS